VSAIAASGADAAFGVTSFIDQFEHFYQLHQPLTTEAIAFESAMSTLPLGGGLDFPESQYEGIVGGTGPGTYDDPWIGPQEDCGWRSGAAHILVVATDASAHSSADGAPYMNDAASAIAAMTAQDVKLIGL